MAKKKNVNAYESVRRKRKGIHKKSLNKDEKRSFKKYNRQGRR